MYIWKYWTLTVAPEFNFFLLETGSSYNNYFIDFLNLFLYQCKLFWLLFMGKLLNQHTIELTLNNEKSIEKIYKNNL